MSSDLTASVHIFSGFHLCFMQVHVWDLHNYEYQYFNEDGSIPEMLQFKVSIKELTRNYTGIEQCISDWFTVQ